MTSFAYEGFDQKLDEKSYLGFYQCLGTHSKHLYQIQFHLYQIQSNKIPGSS